MLAGIATKHGLSLTRGPLVNCMLVLDRTGNICWEGTRSEGKLTPLDIYHHQRTREIWASTYNASVFPSSTEWCIRSKTLIAFPFNSSSFFLDALEPLPRPNPEKRRGSHDCWCSLINMRMKLARGPCPCRLGRNDNKNELEGAL